MQEISNRDSAGATCYHGGSMIRKPQPEWEAWYRELSSEGIQNKLTAMGVEKFHWDEECGGMVQRCLVPNFPHQWSATMLKDAAVSVLELIEQLDAENLALKDALPENIVYHFSVPRHVDVGSIVRKGDLAKIDWLVEQCGTFQELSVGVIANHFIPFFLMPVLAMSVRQHDRVRDVLYKNGIERKFAPIGLDELYPDVSLTFSYIRGLARLSIRNLLKRFRGGDELYFLKRAVWEWCRSLFKPSEKKFPSVQKLRMETELKIFPGDTLLPVVARLKALVEQLDVTPSKTGYELYYDSKLKTQHSVEAVELDGKQQTVLDVVGNCEGQRWLDLGSNTGWYARELLRKKADVIAVEADEFCADQLYWYARDKRLNMLTIVEDLAGVVKQWPFQVESPLRLLRYTFQADGCLMLGLLHHLVLGRGVSAFQVIQFLKDAAKKMVIVEFVGLDDEKVANNPSVFPHAADASRLHYTLEEIVSELQKQFRQVEVFPSDVLARRMIVASN